MEVLGLVGSAWYTVRVVARVEGCGEECSAYSGAVRARPSCGHQCADGSCVNKYVPRIELGVQAFQATSCCAGQSGATGTPSVLTAQTSELHLSLP